MRPVLACRRVQSAGFPSIIVSPSRRCRRCSIKRRRKSRGAGTKQPPPNPEACLMPDGYALEKPLSLSCPECGGVLRPDDQGDIRRYRCHIGHILTGETVLAAQFDLLEVRIASCLALLNERAELCNQLAADARTRAEDPAPFEQ